MSMRGTCEVCDEPVSTVHSQSHYIDSYPMEPMWEGGPMVSIPVGVPKKVYVGKTLTVFPCGHEVKQLKVVQ